MSPTLDDAKDAADRVEFHFNADDSFNMKLIHEFFENLSACKMPTEPDRPERDFYIIEGAMQHGFEWIDDDGELFTVSQSKLMDFVNLFIADTDRQVDECARLATAAQVAVNRALWKGAYITLVVSNVVWCVALFAILTK